jgi:predicted transcriptional regulator
VTDKRPANDPLGHDKDEPRFVQGAGGSVADARTGQVLDTAYTAVLFPKRKNGFGRRWFAMAQGEALAVLKGFKRVDDFRVLMALLEELDFNNLILVSQTAIAKDLGMDTAQVNRAMKRLIEVGAIVEGPRVGTHRTYRLSPNFGWKGSASSHLEALDDEQKKLKARMAKAGISGVVKEVSAEEIFAVPGQLDLFPQRDSP